MKKVLAYLKHTKKETILGPLFKMLEVCFELLVPMLVSNIVDNGIKNGDDADVKYIIIMCLIMFVFAVLGFVTYNGMTAEQFIFAWFKSEILTPKRLTFKATNIYYETNKETIEKLEKKGLKTDENIKGNI